MGTLEKVKNVQSSSSIETSNPSKLLSICMFGRDDDYMLDFLYRITTTINHLSRSINNLGQKEQIEILVTDWGSDIPMAQTLKLSQEASEICSFIYVPQDVIRETQEGKDYLHTARAANVAIRRACGRYIVLYNADTLILEHSLYQVLQLIQGKINVPIDIASAFIPIPRINVPWQFLERSPSIEEWNRYLHIFGKNELLEPKYYQVFAHAGAIMMHRKLWDKLRAFDESLSGWGFSDIDIGFRVTQNHPVFSLSCIGVFLYHMEHKSEGRRQVAISQGIRNPNRLSAAEIANDENWGLGNFKLSIQAPQKRNADDYVESKSLNHNRTSKESAFQSAGEILSELTHTTLIQSIKRMLKSCFSRGWKLERSELNAIFFLSWYSGKNYPRRYLDFYSNSISVGTVVAKCPSVEVYKIGHWEGTEPDDSPFTLRHILDTFGFRGYVRFVNGDIRSAIQRLKESFIGPFGFDLIFVGGKNANKVADNQVCDLISCLSSRGALILSYPSADDFMRIWQKIQDNYHQYTYFQCADKKTGMVLAAKLQDHNSDKISQIGNILFDTKWLTATRIKGIFLSILIKIYERAFALFRV